MTETEFLKAFNQPWRVEALNEVFVNANRPAAVLICLYYQAQQLHVIFTQRALHLKHHAGQVSFPGGKAEDFDANLVETAYREAKEEIGLNIEQLKLLGNLPIYKTISGFAVKPIVSIYQTSLDIKQDLVIDANEVDSVFSVPLAYLMQENNYHIEKLRRCEESLPVYFIPYQNKMIWGATAGMLAQLKSHINSHPQVSI